MGTSELLVRYGFINKKYKHKYEFDEGKGEFKTKDGSPVDAKHADEEFTEEASTQVTEAYFLTGYPSPLKRYRLILDTFSSSVEEVYYWILNHLRIDWGYHDVIKVTDIFTASENSAFFGQSAQRLSIQQDRAAQFLRGISELIRQLFQLVRELRIIDERLELYEKRMAWVDEKGKVQKPSKSADVTLKGLYIDLAEGGTKNPSSVYGLAQQVGFTILPDLFFNTHIYDKNKLDSYVDKMEYNQQVKNILKRKLLAYIVWAEKTHEEHNNRKRFQIQYLRQHWATIKMYMAWIKPYLKTIKRLTMNQDQMDSPDLVTSFETSLTEIEFVAHKPPKPRTKYCPVIIGTFEYRTKPAMSYRQEYQQGPLHMGEMKMSLRAYTWTTDQINHYKNMKNTEDFELLGIADTQIQAAMDALGDDLKMYLEQAEKGVEEWEKERLRKANTKKKKASVEFKLGEGIFAPVVGLVNGLRELFEALFGIKGEGNPFSLIGDLVGSGKPKLGSAGAAKGEVLFNTWQTYKNYKKAHKLLAW